MSAAKKIGLVLIVFGLASLIRVLGIIDFSIIRTMIHFWPLAVIFFGLHLVFDNDKATIALLFLYIIAIIAIGIYDVDVKDFLHIRRGW